MVRNKIICVLMTVVFLVCLLCVPASAQTTFTEYTQASGFAISDSVREILSGYAFNYINSNYFGNQIYEYWVGVRVGEYQYLLLFFDDLSDMKFTSSGYSFTDGEAMIYDERAYSYTDNYRTYYQPGVSYIGDYPVNLNTNYMNIIGNLSSTVNSMFFDRSYIDDNNASLRNILICLIVFLLLFVAFKFLNKRWLLP